MRFQYIPIKTAREGEKNMIVRNSSASKKKLDFFYAAAGNVKL